MTNNLTTPWSRGEELIWLNIFQEILTKNNFSNSKLAYLFDWFASEKERLRPSPHESRHFQGRISGEGAGGAPKGKFKQYYGIFRSGRIQRGVFNKKFQCKLLHIPREGL